MAQLEHKGIIMLNNTDTNISELLKVDRSSVTKWRSGKRYPKFDEVMKYEELLGLPFECFLSRNPDLLLIKSKLEIQLSAIKKIIKNRKNIE